MPNFSARLHIVCIVDDAGHAGDPPKYTCDNPIVLFRADNDEDAFRKALVLGKEQETTYENSDGVTVRWALRAVEQIWRLPDNLECAEVGSILDVHTPAMRYDIDTVFEPEKIPPCFNDEHGRENIMRTDTISPSDSVESATDPISPPRAKLVSQDDETEIELRHSPVKIGRRNTCDIVLAHAKLSGHHAELKFESGSWRIRDLRTRNGIRLNGQRLRSVIWHELRPGDEVCLAELKFVFSE